MAQGYEKMIVGDDCGNIALYDVHDRSSEGIAGSVSASSYRLTREKRHSDWVTKVRDAPTLNPHTHTHTHMRMHTHPNTQLSHSYSTHTHSLSLSQ